MKPGSRSPAPLLWILFHSLLAKRPALLHDRFGVEYLCLVSKTDNPAQEHRGNRYLHRQIEVFLAVGDEHDIMAEPIDDGIEKAFVKPHLYCRFLTGIHLEQPIGVTIERLSG